ncbi:magnesium transporter [bacterium]|nr:magnesium transporter [candidate division CSSED10-310 bacterium]
MREAKYRLNLETIRRLIRKEAEQNLQRLLKRMHPVDIAALANDLSIDELVNVFHHLPDDETRSMVLVELETDVAGELLGQLEPAGIRSMLKVMAPDDAAALVDSLPDERADELQKVLTGQELDQVEVLLTYPEETAGRIMTQQVFALQGDLTVREAIDAIRSAEKAETVFYVYVVDEYRKLLGVVSLRRLLLEKIETPLKEIMVSDVIAVTPERDQEEVAHIVARYDLLAVPVVDDGGFLLGIITVDDIIDIIHEEAREDMYRMAGSNLSEHEMTSPLRMAGVRIKWLLLRVAGATCAGMILYFAMKTFGFSSTQAWIISLFPLFLGLISGIGSQSSMIVAEQLNLRSDFTAKFLPLLGTESLIGLILGLCISVLPVAILGYFSIMPWINAFIVGAGLVIGMVVAATAGTCIPYVFFRFDRDPVIVTGSLITTILDVIAVAVFIGSLMNIYTG